MGTLDIVMLVFLLLVLAGAIAGFFYYNGKEED